jgi:nucleoside-diphosphate-sugar epimerase
MKKALVTGGAGFIGRWLVKKLLDEDIDVWVIDNLENGREENLKEFEYHPRLKDVVIADILDVPKLNQLFKNKLDIVFHLAAQINVHESLETPEKSYQSNILGTYNVLEACRPNLTKLMLMGTCMVYDVADSKIAISENHTVKPASPYAGSKLAAEVLAESYFYGYGLPLITCRPFNTYGPFQKNNMEGGVVSIFVKKEIDGEELHIFGDGTQTRDLLYVEDCVDFLYNAACNEKAIGQVINAGLGEDVTIKDLAAMVSQNPDRIKYIPHHHPQSEIQKLLCDYSKAKAMLGWEPKTNLKMGIQKTRQWFLSQSDLG